ncbi:DUF4258 domain-containing protein [Flavobacterium sp. SM15]|uniref:DUF4258 domain-containing protein n=1 Tax=Flavobacterium sp. SM15 TaxID=2908005 RepID=UPI001EDA9B39|nr:DUF4258 domain-containing protein [Flavobacterium sp. SM15]MCG2611704.1 DUF4258 domain-containing protein [Flavobacterium sp. SM15]
MKFAHRLAYYLFGLLLGGMFLVFFFQKKKTEFCYMPNCRVLKDLRSKPLEISKEAQSKLNEKWVTMEDIKACLENGDVDFSKSNQPLDNGKLYIIEGKNTKNEDIIVEMVNKSERVMLKDIKKQ